MINVSEIHHKSTALFLKDINNKVLNSIIDQIIKDLSKAGFKIDYEGLDKADFLRIFRDILINMVEEQTNLLFTFLYIADVSEESISLSVKHNNVLDVDELLYFILKREYIKIAYRAGLIWI